MIPLRTLIFLWLTAGMIACQAPWPGSLLADDGHYELRCGETRADHGPSHIRLAARYQWQVRLSENRLRRTGRVAPNEVCTSYRKIDLFRGH